MLLGYLPVSEHKLRGNIARAQIGSDDGCPLAKEVAVESSATHPQHGAGRMRNDAVCCR